MPYSTIVEVFPLHHTYQLDGSHFSQNHFQPGHEANVANFASQLIKSTANRCHVG